MSSSCRVKSSKMKVLVVLSLLSLAAAKPQFINHPQAILTPTVKTTGATPLTNIYTVGQTPLTNLYTAGQNPLTNLYTAGQNPLTNLYTAGQNPLTNLYTAGQNPLTNLYTVGQNPLTNLYTAGQTPINTYTASYPYTGNGFPFVRAALPSSFGFPYNYPFTPLIAAAKPAEEATLDTSRNKRSAEPEAEAEADPQLIYTTGLTSTGSSINYPTVATIPTTAQVQYTGFPAAVSTYTYPQTIPYTGINPITSFNPQTIPYTGINPITSYSPYTGLTGYNGLTPYTGIRPYNAFPWFNPIVTRAETAKAEEDAVSRSKRSADPKADPQLLTTGWNTGFNYPAVNTGLPGAYTYQTLPTQYSRIPTAYSSIPTAYWGANNRVVYG